MKTPHRASYVALRWPANWTRTERRKAANFSGDRTLSRSVRELFAQVSKIAGVDPATIVVTCGDARDPDPGAAVYFSTRSNGPVVLASDKWDLTAHNVWAIAKHVEAVRGCERWGVGTAKQAWAGFQALPQSSAPKCEHSWVTASVGRPGKVDGGTHASAGLVDVCAKCSMSRPHEHTYQQRVVDGAPRSRCTCGAEPNPSPKRATKGWRSVLGFSPTARPSEDAVRAKHRDLIRQHHTDVGGDASLAASINAARDEALAELEDA